MAQKASTPPSSAPSKRPLIMRARSFSVTSSPQKQRRELHLSQSSPDLLSIESTTELPPPRASDLLLMPTSKFPLQADLLQPAPPKPETVATALFKNLIPRKHIANQDQLLQDRVVRYFNLNVNIGARFFRDEVLPEETSPLEADAKFALFLKTTPGVNKVKLGQFLVGNKSVRDEFIKTFDFSSFPANPHGVEQAFRYFQSFFRIPGEGQAIDRVLDEFSQRFHFFHPTDLVLTTHQFAFLILLLNTSLGNPAAASSDKPPSREVFCRRYAQILCNHTEGLQITVEDLAAMYDSVKQNPIIHVPDRDQLAGNLFTKPDMSGWLKMNCTKQQHHWFVMRPPQWMNGKTRFVMLAENSLYLFRHATDTEFELMLPLENLRIFTESPEPQQQQKKMDGLFSCTNAASAAASRFKLLFLPREPVQHIKLGRLTKKHGMKMEMVSSITLRTASASEFDCWLSVLTQKGLGRSQTYPMLMTSPLPNPRSTMSKSSWSSSTGTLTPKYYGFAELREVMHKNSFAEEEEDKAEMTLTIV